LTYNAQFNFCFPTIKAIPLQDFPPAFFAPGFHPELEPNYQRTRPLFAAGWGPYQTSGTGQPTFASHTKLFSAHSAQLSPGLRKPPIITGINGNPRLSYQPRAIDSAPRSIPAAMAGSNRAANHTCPKTTVKHP
jgi:hypothetical protein